ncbi:MAG TPA: hypothetical protein VME67_03685 [Mycobacterium sp.]|nr:hypothetical protein [Mycobacterium sp.]HTX94004.1 hypothetical protein [Mycobacterium sp.]
MIGYTNVQYLIDLAGAVDQRSEHLADELRELAQQLAALVEEC